MKSPMVIAALVVIFFAGSLARAQDVPKHHDKAEIEKGKSGVKVICFLCDDLTMDKSEAVEMKYKGKQIFLCSSSEKEPFEKDPEKWVNTTDPVCSKTVNKTTTKYWHDQKVKYTNKKGVERINFKRYFFDSKKHMAEFKTHPEKYVTGKYVALTD